MEKTLWLLPVLILAVLLSAGVALAGPYTGDGIDLYIGDEVNPSFTGWATGYLNYLPAPASDPSKDGQYTPGGGVATQFRTPDNVIGVAGSGIVSLGDLSADQIAAGVAPGEITLTFDTAIVNGAGYDFAMFENGFASGGGIFAELGYVDVSTDGVNFARFDSVSLTPGAVGGYGTIDPTDVHNLVGKHPNNYGTNEGTGFDLDELLDNELVLAGLVDLGNISFVRVVDIPGSGDFLDAQGNPIYDAHETWGSGGVDLDAIGVINAVPVPGAVWLLGGGLLALIGVRRRK